MVSRVMRANHKRLFFKFYVGLFGQAAPMTPSVGLHGQSFRAAEYHAIS